MQRFTDPDGRTWDVVLGRESWGTLYALFIPAGRGRSEPVRQAPLDATGYDEAQLLLADLDRQGMAELFQRSVPKET